MRSFVGRLTVRFDKEDILTQPEVTATPTAAPAPATVQQLSIADIRARVVAILKEPDDDGNAGLDDEDLALLERIEQVQIAGNKWKVGDTVPERSDLAIFALYVGQDNDRIADPMQGDVRVYAVPLTVSQPGARDYRRFIVNPVVGKAITHSLTYEGFCQEVAEEEMTTAERQGIFDDEDDAPETVS